METKEIKGLCPCKKCGSVNKVNLFSNSRHQFQIKCENCGNKTPWMSKTDAVIYWFNQWF